MSTRVSWQSVLKVLPFALLLLLPTPVPAAGPVKINDLAVATTIPDAQREATINAARAFYDFWNTGDESLLREAIAPTFTDRTCRPDGRRDRMAPLSRRADFARPYRT
jgi:hypothetical protein